MEAIHKKKGETARIKALKEQVGTNHGASVGMTTVTISSFYPWCVVGCSLARVYVYLFSGI